MRTASSATAVPSVFEEKVECVDPGGKTSGEMRSSRAQTPLSGFRPLVSALPKTMMSGVTPNCSIAQNLLQSRKVAGRRNHVAAGALNGFHVESRELRLSGFGVPE